jgi:lipoyl synthase
MGRVKRNIPDWIRFKIPSGAAYKTVASTVKAHSLHTVCVEAKCPNVGECFACKTATFMIMGDTCTRNCRYCAVGQDTPKPVDPDEPFHVAEAVTELGLKYAVITSVTRDDIADGGASLFADTVKCIRTKSPRCRVELLVPDFRPHMPRSLQEVIEAQPDVINHNIEVVKGFYDELRPLGNYNLSLELLKQVNGSNIPAKSGLMIGFGESMDDIRNTLEDLVHTGCRMLTVGQYLQSRRDGFPVVKYYHPDEFKQISEMAYTMGFDQVMSGPLVRSSYHAAEMAGE